MNRAHQDRADRIEAASWIVALALASWLIFIAAFAGLVAVVHCVGRLL